eukprot:1161862-Pelagomonas_calceolata.AAC.3
MSGGQMGPRAKCPGMSCWGLGRRWPAWPAQRTPYPDTWCAGQANLFIGFMFGWPVNAAGDAGGCRRVQHVEERAHNLEIGVGAGADCGASGNACSNAHSNACSDARSNACSNVHMNAVLMVHSCSHVHHCMLQCYQRSSANFSASLATLPSLVTTVSGWLSI